MKTKIALSLMAIVMAATMIVSGTMAYFTDTTSQNTATFSAGTINVAVNEDAQISIPNSYGMLQPGEAMTEDIVIDINNKGTLNAVVFGDLGYEGDQNLLDKLYIEDATTGIWNGSAFIDTDHFIANGESPYYTGDTFMTEGKISLKKFISNANTGMDATGEYQFYSALKPGKLFRITLKLGLFGSADENCMGKSGHLTFRATGIQATKNAILDFGHGFSDYAFMLNKLNGQ